MGQAPGCSAPRVRASPGHPAGLGQGATLETPADMTPELFQGITVAAPQLLDLLTPDHLRSFSPEVQAWLPGDYIETLDAELQIELAELAEPAGGLGVLWLEAAEAAAALAADAPELSGAWRAEPEEGSPTGPAPSFETAADLMTSGFTASAAELLNLLVESGQPQTPQLMADLTPEVIAWLAEVQRSLPKPQATT